MGLTSRIAYHLEAVKGKNNWFSHQRFQSHFRGDYQYESGGLYYERIGERYNHLMIDEFQDILCFSGIIFCRFYCTL